MNLTSNIEQMFAGLNAYVSDVTSIAAPRAFNTLRDQAQVAGLRKINDIYQIGPRSTERYITVKNATAANPEASITAKGNGYPLYLLKPRETAQGVSVLIKGKRYLIKHAFLATMRNGHVGVFSRGSYGGKSAGLKPTGQGFGRFAFGRGRLPINELYTFGPAESLSNPEVTRAMDDRVTEQYVDVFAREIKRARSGH